MERHSFGRWQARAARAGRWNGALGRIRAAGGWRCSSTRSCQRCQASALRSLHLGTGEVQTWRAGPV